MHREEELRLLKLQLEEDTAAVDLQDAELEDLQKKIDAEQQTLQDLTARVMEERDIKKREEDRHRIA